MAKTKPTPADPPPADAEVRASAPPEAPAAEPGPEADAAPETPAGPPRFEVSVPGCTLPKRVVEAATAGGAVDAYKAKFGVTSFPAGVVVEPTDAPASE